MRATIDEEKAMDLYPWVLLACPIGMGLMMWIMMRGGSDSSQASRDKEIDDLRSEVEHLRSARKPEASHHGMPENQIGQ